MADAMPTETMEAARSSIEKAPVQEAGPVDRLPEEIIEQILRSADANGFASLIVLSRKWRAVSQRADLYLHHLAQCPSFAASHPTLPPAADDERLPLLRQLFAREVKRNLLEPYLRPNETVIKLVSNSISSSSSPGGEGMQFSASPRAHHLLAYNSARIYVIDIRGPSLEVKREFKILRRPASACIKDDGSLLAVLSTEMQVDVYDLQQSPPRRRQSILLDNTPRTIAMSPCGSVLAAAYEGGIEVSSLNPSALPTDRRAVKCDGVDSLAFSFDGTQILGTTVHQSPPSTVILTAPYYDPSSHAHEDNIGAMWTTSILFPNTSRDCSHAVLLEDGDQEEAAWAFTYDRSFETFRAIRIDDLRNGTTYFTGPVPDAESQAKLLPSTLPATTHHGELVSAGFHGKEIWVYGVPEDLDAVPDTAALPNNETTSSSSVLGRRESSKSNVSRHPSTRGQDTAGGRVPQWQLLCDKLRNTFVAGEKVSEVAGVSNVKWVTGFGDSPLSERLVVTAPGVSATPRPVTEEEDMDFVDGGRIILVDFDYRLTNGSKTEITIEVGTDEAEVLEEERRDLETEVAIVRRRTVAQKRGNHNALLRAATTSARTFEAHALPRIDHEDDDPLLPRRIGRNPAASPAVTVEPADSEEASIEEQEALDAPYAHASPRSGMTLRRAATAAAVNRIRNPRTADGRPIEYRRADGRGEVPHESDADNWVPPPPPYQEDDPGDVPAFLRGPAVTSMPAMPVTIGNLSRHHTMGPETPRGQGLTPVRPSHQRTASDSTTFSRPRTDEIPRPRSTPSVHVDMDDLYDVSPQESPRLPAAQLAVHQPPQTESRLASGSTVSSIMTTRPDTAQTHSSAVVMAEPDATSFSGQSHDTALSGVPSLGLRIPPSNPAMVHPSNDTTPTVKTLSNTQTWPASAPADHAASSTAMLGYPLSAPAEYPSGLPPAPRSDQMESLNKRISQGNPKRLSGAFQVPRVPVGGRREGSGSSFQPPPPLRAAERSNSWQTEPDQPLIISTPKGVSGAFDSPGQRTSEHRGDMPIMAPVPRHPQPMHGSHPRATVERLETIYSGGSSQGANPRGSMPRASRSTSNLLAKWLAPASGSSNKSSNGVKRNSSRAERSAAKNMMDAKKRGWAPSSSGKRKKKKNRAESDMASTAGWTDVSAGSAMKDKKCAVM